MGIQPGGGTAYRPLRLAEGSASLTPAVRVSGGQDRCSPETLCQRSADSCTPRRVSPEPTSWSCLRFFTLEGEIFFSQI